MRNLNTTFSWAWLGKEPIENLNRKYARALKQEQTHYEERISKGVLLLWASFYGLQLILSDLQKSDPKPWLMFRGLSLLVIVITMGTFFTPLAHSKKRVALFLCAVFLPVAYAWMTKYGLPMRTSWVFILPATVLAPFARSFVSGLVFLGLVAGTSMGFVWKGEYNPIWTVNDLLFGALIVGLSTILRHLWLKSEEQALISREALENDIKNQEAIYRKLAQFIPRSIHKRIDSKLKKMESIESALSEYLDIRDRFVAILYSDFRDYSRRSADLDFVRNELAECHSQTIRIVESFEGVPQQAGDSVLAYFSYEEEKICISRALSAAAQCTEFERERCRSLGLKNFERYFIVTSGRANVGNVFGSDRFEISVNGKPANLASRLDEVTKNEFLKKRINCESAFIVDFATKSLMKEVFPTISIREVDLRSLGVQLRTYEEERRIYLVSIDDPGVRKELFSSGADEDKLEGLSNVRKIAQ